MGTNEEQAPSFESVKERLQEIAEAVDDESISLDDALDLYEEAVSLGLQASDLLETGIVVADEEADSAENQSEQAAAEPEAAAEREAAAEPADK